MENHVDLQSLQGRRRDRVLGNGPKRNTLPNFRELLQIENFDALKDEVIRVCFENKGKNDLYTTKYEISKHCDLRDMLPAEHVNLLLQEPKAGVVPVDEREFTEWNRLSEGMQIRKLIEENFGPTYRTRIALLAPHSAIDWHIDMNTTISCRVHIPIYNPGFIFEIKSKSGTESLVMEPGKVYFTNTAWPHRVYNHSSERRISVITDMPYSSLEQWMRPKSPTTDTTP